MDTTSFEKVSGASVQYALIKKENAIKMIKIKKSLTADTRTCNASEVKKSQLKDSSIQHIEDVSKGLGLLASMMYDAAVNHDHDKLTGINEFHSDFITNFEKTEWYENHKKVNRHHLLTQDGVPQDVNLIDVLEMIVDCVMAGMGRSGSVYPLEIDSEVLKNAFDNTVDLIKNKVIVEED